MKTLRSICTALLVAACARPQPAGNIATPATAPGRTVIPVSFAGEGSLETKGEHGKTRLALERLNVSAKTTGDVAETTVEHVFRNDANEVLEGTFRFPLPEGAILTGLAMEIDGKLTDGELVEREKARKAYEQVVDEMLDPALLEWENGQTFKLRVFPIEPAKDKRIVIRFVAPLHRTDGGLFFAFRPPGTDAQLTTEKVKVTVDGRAVAASAERAATGEVLVRVAEKAPDVVAETTKDGAYWLAHVRPTFGAGNASAPSAGQALIVLCDRSRSMLEARGLQKKTLGLLLDQLGERDRFTVVTGDVQTKALGPLRSTTEKPAALAFVDAVEPDGASDVGRLVAGAVEPIREARASGLDPVVVYVGDGSATWGETRAAELERATKAALGGATMHVVVLGKSTDDLAAHALAAGGHGRLVRPKTEVDAARAALEIARARGQRRLVDVHLVGAEGVDVPSAIPSTIYDGDEVAIALRAAKDRAPGELRLVGMDGGTPYSQPIALSGAKPAEHVAQRWAKAKIDRFERDGDAHKEDVVKTSLEHGVMSRYTAFLVLDSEEAYARFEIARKTKAKADADARVSGRDLEGDGRGASVSPDHLQPGDPEVRIPAPADAASVVVMFPFGETKTASFEAGEGAHGGVWVTRFLVDRTTPDGTYEILVRITHRDGRVELVKLPYVVDTKRPSFDVKVTPKANGKYEIRAKQRLTEAEIEAQAPSSAGTFAERRERYAHILTDAKRVEVRTPDGQTLALVHLRLGEFIGTWTPAGSVSAGARLRLVAVDRALNESVLDIEVPR